MPKHAFDPETDFCLRCDASREEYVDLGVPCTDADNIVSYRHHKCRQFMDRMTAVVLAAMRQEPGLAKRMLEELG